MAMLDLTPSPTDTFTITPGLLADAPAIEDAEHAAGDRTVFQTLLWSPPNPSAPPPLHPPPRPPTPGSERAALAGDARPQAFVLTRMELARFEYVVARRDGDGAVVGFALWEWHPGRSAREWRHFWETRDRPAGMNRGLCDATSGERVLKRPGILGERPFASAFCRLTDDRDSWRLTFGQDLQELFVRPEFQRKGLGGRLVEWGIKRAEEKGLQVYVEATEAGRGLYLRYGMKEVDRVDVDLEPWGAKNGEWNRFALLHKPAPNAA